MTAMSFENASRSGFAPLRTSTVTVQTEHEKFVDRVYMAVMNSENAELMRQVQLGFTQKATSGIVTEGSTGLNDIIGLSFDGVRTRIRYATERLGSTNAPEAVVLESARAFAQDFNTILKDARSSIGGVRYGSSFDDMMAPFFSAIAKLTDVSMEKKMSELTDRYGMLRTE